MRNFVKHRALPALILAALSVPAVASPEDNRGEFAMAGDLLVARPIGAVATVAGTALFVLSLPFSALGGNVKQAADVLVIGPAKETFMRCLGCVSSGYRGEDVVDQ
jgi:hypothetical protein